MAKGLNFNLLSQSKIKQEGQIPNEVPAIAVGTRHVEFFVPDVSDEFSREVVQQNSSKAQELVSRINQFIENIADDYFLLGLHLIAVHKALKNANLDTVKMKAWYVEHINMPYSSAMQCRKVAEIYADQPQLIGRYTASGAYLLSACTNHAERDQLWNEARRGKANPTIRELREVLKHHKGKELIEIHVEEEDSAANLDFRQQGRLIYDSFQVLVKSAEAAKNCQDSSEFHLLRRGLIRSTQELLNKLKELEE